MNNLKRPPGDSLLESLGSSTDTFRIELTRESFDIDILGDLVIDESDIKYGQGKLKFDTKDKLLKDLKDIGFDKDYDIEVDEWASQVILEYYWDVDSRSYGIKDFEFVPVRLALRLVVLKIYDDSDEELTFEIEFTEFKSINYKTELAFPLSEINIELTCKEIKSNSVEDVSNWSFGFEIGNSN